jgi:hypothetical protein
MLMQERPTQKPDQLVAIVVRHVLLKTDGGHDAPLDVSLCVLAMVRRVFQQRLYVIRQHRVTMELGLRHSLQ